MTTPPGVPTCRARNFAEATSTLPGYLSATPKIVNATVEGTDWSELGEMAVQK